VHVVRGGYLGEVAVRAAVDVGYGDDVRVCGEGLENVGCGGGAGAEGEGIAGVLEGGDGAFKVVSVRIARARVLIPKDYEVSNSSNVFIQEFAYSPTGFPNPVWANVVLRLIDSITAPVTGSCGLPACTASVPNLCTGDGARGGVSIGTSETVIFAVGEVWEKVVLWAHGGSIASLGWTNSMCSEAL
jgi:hypothetical protein